MSGDGRRLTAMRRSNRNGDNRMHLLIWNIVGVATGWATRKMLAEAGYGTIVNSMVAVGGALCGGLILMFTSPAAQKQLVHTSLGAVLGAAIASGFTILIIGRKRLV